MKQKAFTLTELLIVISTIVVLGIVFILLILKAISIIHH
jgi:competence protein ComGC